MQYKRVLVSKPGWMPLSSHIIPERSLRRAWPIQGCRTKTRPQTVGDDSLGDFLAVQWFVCFFKHFDYGLPPSKFFNHPVGTNRTSADSRSTPSIEYSKLRFTHDLPPPVPALFTQVSPRNLTTLVLAVSKITKRPIRLDTRAFAKVG